MRYSLPSEGLYPIRVLAAGGVIYGAASVLGGSGFLAVFVAGVVIGDARAPYKSEIERFHSALASLAEISVFVALGLTIDLTDVLGSRDLLDGLVVAALLFFVARPLTVLLLLLPARLRREERLLIAWGGLKGAVPILLAAFVLLAGADNGNRIYDIVFVVVALSVIVQGSSIAVGRAPARRADADAGAGAVGRLHPPAQRAARPASLRRHGRRARGRPDDPRPPARRACLDQPRRPRRPGAPGAGLARAGAGRRAARARRRTRVPGPAAAVRGIGSAEE